MLFVLWLGAWFVLSGGVQKTQNFAIQEFYEASAKAGFRLNNIYVEGRENTDASLLMALINAEKGMPLFAVDPHKIRIALADISWIESIAVKRVFPDSVHINIVERKPAALWLNEGRLMVVDRTGYQITTQNVDRFEDLLILNGKDAPVHLDVLQSYLSAVPEVAERIDQATLIGKRRWDLHLKNKITVNLPEDNIGLALQRLLKTHQEDGILDKTIKNVDLRQDDRLIIEAYPGTAQKQYSFVSGKGSPI
tara:strand:+ start:138 stop:890 length:753 start_codon:yes stop_codon:yes gene_type:complete